LFLDSKSGCCEINRTCLRLRLIADSVAFDKQNEVHQRMLRNLWEGFFEPGSAPEFAASSEQWKEFGFQGLDPTTDFRGEPLHCVVLFTAVDFSIRSNV
jgi:hypothetical protein